MGKYWHWTFLSLVSISAAAILFSPEAAAQDKVTSSTLIKNVKVFDGASDQLTVGDVLIENNLIKSVGDNIAAPTGTTVIDGKEHAMTYKLVFALFCAVIAQENLPVAASEPLAIEWNQLVPDKAFEDPFEKLSDDQLQDLGYAARVRSLIAGKKINSSGPDAKAAGEIEQRLKNAGVDIGYLLSLRDQVRRIRSMQASAVAPELVGKEVRLVAFVVPSKRSGDRVTECFLVGNYDACSHSSPPPANQAVFLRLPEGFVLPSTRTPVRVTGRLEKQQTTRLRVNASGLVEMKAAYSMTEPVIELFDHQPDLKLSQQ